MPTKLGGMVILNVIDTAQCEYEASVELTSNLKDDIIRQLDLSSPSYANNKALKDLKHKKNASNKRALEELRANDTTSIESKQHCKM